MPTPIDALADWVVGHVQEWEVQRDNEHSERWHDYYRIWRGLWTPQEMSRASERSRVIMPALSQAIESAVSEMVEATFSREVWFDAQESVFADLAEQLRDDLWHIKQPISEIFLLGCVYGTGIGKIVIDSSRPFRQTLRPIDPFEFVIDPASATIEEAMGVAHVIYVPTNVVHKRMREGVYDQVDFSSSTPDTGRMHRKAQELVPTETDLVRLTEWHGLVPKELLPESEEEGLGDENLVEGIVTVVNDHSVIRANPNPFGDDRGFISYQHDAVPRRFWGRGVTEKGYWPQKSLDVEIRARIDALSFSTHPMMAINQTMVPRGERFSVRPGRNVFLQGPVAGNIEALSFPPPDPQTYQQSQEMQRMVELGTGQLQAFGQNIDTRNAPASGISMIFGAQVRRTKRALSNVERDFLDPLLRKMLRRHVEFDRRYPNDADLVEGFQPKFRAGLGMMAREFEISQLSQLLSTMPPGPASMSLMKLILENSSLIEKDEVIQILNASISEQMTQGERDLSGEARMLSATTRAEEVAAKAQLEAAKLAQRQEEIASLEADRERRHQEAMVKASLDAALKEAQIVREETQAILNVAKAEAEELGRQREEIAEFVRGLNGSAAAPT